MVANSKIKHKFEIMLEVIRGVKLDFVSLLFYCMTKYPLLEFHRKIQDKIHYTSLDVY